MLDPHTRPLDEPELVALVQRVAAAPESWAHLVAHRPDERTYEQLYRDDNVGVWLICWMNDHDTGFHDHDLSAGALTVTAGRVREERLRVGGPPATRLLERGETIFFTGADIHRVSHAGTEPAVTVHAYSPPLWRMGSYEVLPDGGLRRHSLSYAEELRPLVT